MRRRDVFLISLSTSVVTFTLLSVLSGSGTAGGGGGHAHGHGVRPERRGSAGVAAGGAVSPSMFKSGEVTPSDVTKYGAWSGTFGRTMRDGSGPLCKPGARHENHNKVMPLKTRDELGKLLNDLQLTGAGAELGVQRGIFSAQTLSQWKVGGKYHLVDPWTHQADYVDAANVALSEQEKIMAEALSRTAPYKDRIVVHRNFSYAAAKDFEDCSLDYVYVDAVHDYDGSLVDLIDWWPKLAWGGVFAGHDYLDVIQHADNPQYRSIFGSKLSADRFAIAVNRQLWPTEESKAEPQWVWLSFYMIK